MDVFPQMIFGTLRPRLVLITTPNFEVNGENRRQYVAYLREADILPSRSSTPSSRALQSMTMTIRMSRKDSSTHRNGLTESSG